MKKLFYTIAFLLVTAFAISSCSEENVKPSDGTTTADPCQFGGPNCPNN